MAFAFQVYSSMFATSALLDSLAVLLLIYVVRVLVFGGRPSRSPPGPPGWPFIGNVFDIPTTYQWETFTAWGDKWGTFVPYGPEDHYTHTTLSHR